MMKKIETIIIKKIKIYVFCFPSFATGGIELLHQLTYSLNKDPSIQAKIFYINSKNNLYPQPEIYTQRYQTKYTTFLSPEENDILIFPQTLAFLANNENFKNIKKIIYWESVDNYYHLTPTNLIHKFPQNVIHLTQSLYAEKFLKNTLKINLNNIFPLTDYLSDEFFQKTSSNPRRPAAAYNARKEYNADFIQKIKQTKEGKNIDFIGFTNSSTQELIKTLNSVSVFVDFGNHPGKDRMPREAAICGCCVITGKRGAAGIKEGDVFIPEEYKFEDKEENIPLIIDKINYIFQNYNTCINDFDEYRRRIKEEKNLFEKQIKEIIKRIKE